ncbi:MAG TPA: hypothetical protein VNM14_06415 [Planctomycetota bacterium]|jgi:hypothetical protein|nr:hypothetical protein [Planctomycetota bacterium]
MASTLLEHWNDVLEAVRGGEFPPEERDRLRSRICRFLIEFYREPAGKIGFPPDFPETSDARIDFPVCPKPPKSPERIRSLIRQISDAVAGSEPAGWL